MKSGIIKKITILAVLLMLNFSASAKPMVKLTSDAYQNKVEVGETFHITIEARDCPGTIEMTQMPPGVKRVYATGTRQITVGGVTTTEMALTFKGQTLGKYTFGPITIGGVKSNVISYEVVPAGDGGRQGGGDGNSTGNGGSGSPQGNQPLAGHNYDPNAGPLFIGKGNEEMFLRASVNKTTAYEQEAIEYTVKLYSSYDIIKFLGAAAAPKFEGFVVEESDKVSSSLSLEQYNGKTYKTAVIAHYIIFPQKSGTLKVLGNTYTVSTDAKQYYHDSYFQTMTVRYPIQLNITPNDIVINVKPLPTPVPQNFIGGVGKFSIYSSMPKTSLTTNTPASLIYTIEGTGNIKYVKLPEISPFLPASIEVYSPENDLNATVGVDNVSGTSKFDYSIVPREAGEFNIPAIDFYYFDPSDGQYKQLRSGAYTITVAQGESSAKSQQAATFNDNLMPIGKTSLKVGTPYIDSILYWLWYVVPIIIFVFSLGAYRKYITDHEDMALLRSKKANKMALKRLAKARQCYTKHQEEQFYDEMLAALWGYLGDKLKMPTSELNRNNVGEEFKKHGVSESTFMPIINLIDECEYAKYTPVERDANMRQLYADAVETLAKVESEYDKTKNIDEDDDTDSGDEENNNYVNTSNTEEVSKGKIDGNENRDSRDELLEASPNGGTAEFEEKRKNQDTQGNIE